MPGKSTTNNNDVAVAAYAKQRFEQFRQTQIAKLKIEKDKLAI